MLIYSKERYVPTDMDIMVIRSTDEEYDGYYYIHRTLYDQAVILNDMYSDDIEALALAITNKPGMREDVEFFFQHTPTPINILAPYLLLVKGALNELVDMVGAIHQMSLPLSFRRMIQIPYNMRNMNPSFSLAIKEEYQMSWQRFFLTAIPYDESMYVQPQMVMTTVDSEGNQKTPTISSNDAEAPTETEVTDAGDGGGDEEDDPFACLFGMEGFGIGENWEEEADAFDAEDKAAAEAEAGGNPVSTTPTPVQPEPVKETPTEAVGVDALLNML